LKTTTKDIEDLDQLCKHDCSVPESDVQAGVLDTIWTIPNQRGVDNSAYTWRRDCALGKTPDWKLNLLPNALLVAIGVVVAVVLAKTI
jgi:hypothetical protein